MPHGLFLGVHGPSSDGYCDYFVNRDMWGPRMAFIMCVTVKLPGVEFEKPGVIAGS